MIAPGPCKQEFLDRENGCLASRTRSREAVCREGQEARVRPTTCTEEQIQAHWIPPRLVTEKEKGNVTTAYGSFPAKFKAALKQLTFLGYTGPSRYHSGAAGLLLCSPS